MNATQTIKVQQVDDGYVTGTHDPRYAYRVIQLVNTLRPLIGDILSAAALQLLMEDGFKVTIVK